jgi:hypothetical protein
MNRDVAKDLFIACEKALGSLTDAEHAIHRIEDDQERKRLLNVLSGVIVEILGSLRAPVEREYPELEPPEPLGQPDTDLSEEDRQFVAELGLLDFELMDRTLLSECASSWRKVARVVGTSMRELQDQLPNVPDSYYAQRVALLVAAGNLESQGNLDHMRFSEVRLPGTDRSAA